MKERGRLRIFRKSLKLNQTQFCEPLNLLQGSYSDIERGKSSITFRMVKDMMARYDLNPYWLFTGNGAMTLSEFEASKVQEEQASYGQDELIKENKLLKEQIETLKGENEALKKLVNLYERK